MITIPVVAADGTQSTVTLDEPVFRYAVLPFQLPAVLMTSPVNYTAFPFQLPVILD